MSSGLTTAHMQFPCFWHHCQENPTPSLCPSGLVSGAEAKGVELGRPQAELSPKAVHRNRGPQPNCGVDKDLFLDPEEGQNKS